MAAPQALVGGARRRWRLTPACLAAALKACAPEVWKREALQPDALGDEALSSYAAIDLAVERCQVALAERA
jgi:hypothetical protein